MLTDTTVRRLLPRMIPGLVVACSHGSTSLGCRRHERWIVEVWDPVEELVDGCAVAQISSGDDFTLYTSQADNDVTGIAKSLPLVAPALGNLASDHRRISIWCDFKDWSFLDRPVLERYTKSRVFHYTQYCL